MTAKVFVRSDDLVRDSFTLAKKIFDSGFRPNVLLVLWRGGPPVGIVVHEFLLYKGIETYHTVVKAESYTGIETRREPRIEDLDRVLERVSADDKVLVVDDIFDSGCTVRQVRAAVMRKSAEVRVATLYMRRNANQTDFVPDYVQEETSQWIVFPHELMDLSLEEIRAKDAYVYELLVDGEPAAG